ncbi:uncharacterized protein [Procambarus clarkii]|uniref:uncharacterized protein n=1 Tax=Procambarus clarkii TaxID=6728 RepID=UPI0037424C2D
MCRTAALLLSLAAVTLARYAWRFPVDYELTLSQPLTTSFSCDGRPYGYYADVDNNCEIYHVCVPVYGYFGAPVHTFQYSFICGNQTTFSQKTLNCDFADEAFPCDQSPSLYAEIPLHDVDADPDAILPS